MASVGNLWSLLSVIGVVFVARALEHPAAVEQWEFTQIEKLASPIERPMTGDQPVNVRAAEYNLTYVNRMLVPAMQRSVVEGFEGDESVEMFAILGDRTILFHERPPNGLRDITRSSGVGEHEGRISATFSDYDHSGRLSLFIAGTEGITIYQRSSDGRFADVTRKAGLGGTLGVVCTSAILGDLDGDGFPDLVVTTYTDLAAPPARAEFTFPNDFSGLDSQLYRNNRDGTFSDVTEFAGLGKNPGRTRKAILADFDNDKRLDILLLRDNKPPVLYLNRGGWRFHDATWDAGDDLTTHAFFEGSVADFNRDGKPDLALWGTHAFRILINEGNAVFEASGTAIMPQPRISLFGFRGLVADLDGDGVEDVLTVDGNGLPRVFSNRSGTFKEVYFKLPAGLEAASLAPLTWPGSNRADLVAIQPGGRVITLRIKASSARGVRHDRN
jgi:hypothetical protein